MADEIRYAACTLFLIYITIEVFAIIKLPMIFQDIILILGNKSVDDLRISAWTLHLFIRLTRTFETTQHYRRLLGGIKNAFLATNDGLR